MSWFRDLNPSIVNLGTVVFNLAQSFLFLGVIGRSWTPSLLGELLAIEAGINLLLAFPNILADVAGYELLKEPDQESRNEIYLSSAKASYGISFLIILLIPLLLLQNHTVNGWLIISYAFIRVLINPILGAMSKRLFSDQYLNLSFLLGAIDQSLLLLPAFLSILWGQSLGVALIIASLIRCLQGLFQLALLSKIFPQNQNSGLKHDSIWNWKKLISRALILSPSQLPTPLLQNSISLIMTALVSQSALAIFSTHRTAAGFLGQFSNALMEPKYPTMLRSNNQLAYCWKISRNAQTYIFCLIPAMLLLFPVLYPVWMGSQYPLDMLLFIVLLLVQFLRQLQQPIATLLRSLNQLVPSLIDNWVPLLLVWLLLAIAEPNTAIGFSLVLLFSELVMLICRIKVASKLFAASAYQ